MCVCMWVTCMESNGVGEQQQQQQRQHIDENLKRAEPGSITGGF